MAKQSRGKGLKYVSGIIRGTCPICGRTATKLLWDVKTKDGKEIKVCKKCRNRDL